MESKTKPKKVLIFNKKEKVIMALEKITDAYSQEEINRLTETAFTFNYKDIDLNKMRKTDLIVIIGDLIKRVNENITIVDNNTSTIDQAEYDRIVIENNQLKSGLKALQDKLKPRDSMMTTSILTANDVMSISSNIGDGYKTWN
jgi:hypothetical protein